MKKFMKRMAALLLAAVLGAGMPVAVPAEEAANAAGSTAAEGVATATPTPAYADPSVVPTNGISGWPEVADISSDTFCVMDADSGIVLAGKSETKQHFPASVTKVLTCFMALKYGNLDDQVTMTQEAVDFAVSGSANLGTQVGEVFTLRDMLYAMMLKSANDIATQIAIYIGGGSLDNYFAMANQEVRAMGCVNTNIHSACGMPDESHYTCAYDLALISREALKYDDFRTIVGTQQYTVPATNMSPARTVASHHPLLMRPDTFPCAGIIGGKTGYTDAAQHVLATYAVRNGRTVIAIQMYDTDMTAECYGACDLINYGADNFSNIALTDGTETVVSGGYVTVPNGTALTALDLTAGAAADGQVSLQLAFNGYPVGGAVMSAADAAAWEENFNVQKYGPTEVPSDGQSDSPEKDSASSANSAETAILDSGERTAVYILLVLIGAGVAAIIITVAVKSSRKKRALDENENAGGNAAPGGGEPAEAPETAAPAANDEDNKEVRPGNIDAGEREGMTGNPKEHQDEKGAAGGHAETEDAADASDSDGHAETEDAADASDSDGHAETEDAADASDSDGHAETEDAADASDSGTHAAAEEADASAVGGTEHAEKSEAEPAGGWLDESDPDENAKH